MKKLIVLAIAMGLMGTFVRAEEAKHMDFDCKKTGQEIAQLIDAVDKIREEADKAWGPSKLMKEGYVIENRLSRMAKVQAVAANVKQNVHATRVKITDVFRDMDYRPSQETVDGVMQVFAQGLDKELSAEHTSLCATIKLFQDTCAQAVKK